MRETFECMDCDKAIKKLQRLKKENKKRKVIICTVDFDSDEESTKITTPEEGCLLVRKSKTIIMNEDTYIPHMQLFSMEQDIKNILHEGIMHDIIFGG